MGLNLRRANVVLPNGSSYSKVRAVISGGVVRLWDASGNLLASGDVALHEVTGLRDHTVTLTSGDTWAVTEVRGCGCGA